MIRLAVAAATLAAVTQVAEARRVCFSGPMRPQIVTSPRGKIAGSGGVIVASGAKFPDWRFRDLNRIVRARIVTIAPGLAIYHPPPLAGIEVILENETHSALTRTQRALTIDATDAAPRVRSITTYPPSNQRAVIAEVEGKTPEHAVIVVVSRVAGDALEPLNWVRIRAGQPGTILVWHSPRSCEETIAAALEPKLGDKIVLQWLDDAGRLSEPSTEISVGAKP